MSDFKPTLIGVLNLTPDSFSDGALYTNPPKALEQISLMVTQGAGVIDIGAESTRPKAPKATLLTPEEEWQRLEPVLKALSKKPVKAEISLDTRHPETAKKALDLGVKWINDVSGIATPDMRDVLKKSDCKVIIMHSLTIPANPDVVMPENTDITAALLRWAKEKIEALIQSGIKKERIVFDPGIGFGKTPKQSMTLIKEAEKFKALGIPLLYGHSRKSFLSLVTDKAAVERDKETALISAYLAKKKVDYLRVHNIAANLKALSKPFKPPTWLA